MGLAPAVALAAAAAAPAWSLSWSPRNDEARALLGQSYRPRRQTTTLLRHFDANARAGLRHEFRFLDLPAVDGVPADTNSYVHRLTLGWQQDGESRRLRLAGTLSVSSNALKNPGDLGAGDLQPALAYGQRAGPVWLALFADDRLGRTLVYPGIELPLAPAPGHEIRLGLPESSWHWQLAPDWRAVAAVEPDGACWRVRDATLSRRSEVCSRAWAASWALQWQPTRHVVAAATIGRSFGGSLTYQLSDGGSARVDVPAGGFYGFTIGAAF